MSHPKRYIACTFVHYNKDGKIGMTESRRVEDPFGEYVQWSDYAALAAENERLRKAWDESAQAAYSWRELYQMLKARWEAAAQEGGAK